MKHKLLILLLLVVFTLAKRKNKSKTQKIKALKIELQNEKNKVRELSQKLKSNSQINPACPNREENSSFLETSVKADPMFKTMSFGFSVPRSTSYSGTPQPNSILY
jgi:hypothetical protein